MDNPFEQKENVWIVKFNILYKNLSIIEEIFEERALTIVSSEVRSSSVDAMPDDEWLIELYLEYEPSSQEIKNLVQNVIYSDTVIIHQLEHKDWLSIAAESLGDIKTEFFHIKRSDDGEIEQGLIPIILNITRAFGTGEHATTFGCLTAIESFKGKNISNVIDIGTGTGILAIAAKKLWPNADVIATDIDAVAIEVAKQHAALNDVAIDYYVADCVNDQISNGQDLILANILAVPLISMSSSLYDMCNSGGFIVLSGFLDNQKEQVFEAYDKLGLVMVLYKTDSNWITVIFHKAA